MLRHLAAQIGTKWRRLVLEIGVPPMRIETILRNSADSDDDTDIIENMLTWWIKRLPRAADKVDAV